MFLNAECIESFRRQLLRLQDEVKAVEAIACDATRPVELDQTAIGRLSRMDAIQGQQMAIEASRRRRQELQRIEAALRRLEAGEFGVCLRCGEDIDPRRLAIDPTATHCIGCAEGGPQ